MGCLKDIVRLYKSVYRNKEKLAFVLHINENKSGSKLAFSLLQKQVEETFFFLSFLTFRRFLKIANHFSTINFLCK